MLTVTLPLLAQGIPTAGLQTLRFKKVWKLREVLNVIVTAGHRPAQAQEEPAGWVRFFCFYLSPQKFLQNRVKILEF